MRRKSTRKGISSAPPPSPAALRRRLEELLPDPLLLALHCNYIDARRGNPAPPPPRASALDKNLVEAILRDGPSSPLVDDDAIRGLFHDSEALNELQLEIFRTDDPASYWFSRVAPAVPVPAPTLPTVVPINKEPATNRQAVGRLIPFAAAAAANQSGPTLVHRIQPAEGAVGLAALYGWVEWTPGVSPADQREPQRWWVTLHFPSAPTDFSPGNDRSRLEKFNGAVVCLERFVAGHETPDRIDARLTLDRDGNLVSDRTLVRVSNPEEEASLKIWLVDRVGPPRGTLGTRRRNRGEAEGTPRGEMRSGTVAFPIISRALPDARDFDDPGEFVGAVHLAPPDWLFHLRVSRSRSRCASAFDMLRDEEVEQLVEKLGLRRLADAPPGYRVEPREFGQDSLPPPGECSDYAFALPGTFLGRSYELAVAVGLVAAATRRPLPPWALLSGGFLEGNFPRLAQTGEIQRKLELALGKGTGHAHIEPLLEMLYEHPTTCRRLGRRDLRVVPGKVRLFVLAADTDTALEDLPSSFLVERISVDLAALGHDSFEEMRRCVEQYADDGMLVVQAATAFDALRLLGYHHRHPFIDAKLRRSAGGPRVSAFRVRHRKPERGQEADLIHCKLRMLELRLAKCGRDPYHRLKTVLEACMAALNCALEGTRNRCYAGDIAMVDTDRRLLRVVALAGQGADQIPFYLPADVGISGRVLRAGKTAVVNRMADDPDFLAATSAEGPVASRYGPEFGKRYKGFLENIHSCVKVPLKRGGESVAVLCLHCDQEFDSKTVENTVPLIEAFASLAAFDVAYLLGGAEAPVIAPRKGPGSDEHLATWTARQTLIARAVVPGARPATAPVAPVLEDLGRELAQLAVRLTGAYRAAVRLITPDRQALEVIGHEGDFPAEFLTQTVSLEEDAAACHAIRQGRSYLLPDTALAYTIEDGKRVPRRYHPVRPEARAHASVLLRAGGHLIAVLSVDWDRVGAADECLLQTLEQLASRYAAALKACSTDALFAVLDDWLLSEAVGSSAGTDYARFLRLVAQMVGARQGSIFLRRQATGRYHLAASLKHPEWSGDDHWYEPGEGITGFVIKHNRPLRIANLHDPAELRAIHPDFPPVWKDKDYDGVIEKDRNETFLGVPIAVGNEVLGVLRLAHVNSKCDFSNYDQQIALAAASRLAGVLYQQQQTRSTELLTRLAAYIVAADSRQQLAAKVLETLDEGLAASTCCVRLLDRTDEPGGTVEALYPLAVKRTGWADMPRSAQRRGEGIAGRVWQTGQPFLSDDMSADPRLRPLLRNDVTDGELIRPCGSLACVPLHANGAFMGTLLIYRENRHSLSPGDLAFLNAVAGLVGSAFKGSEESESFTLELLLHRALEGHYRACLAGGSFDDPVARLLDAIRQALVSCLGCQLGLVWRFDPASRNFHSLRDDDPAHELSASAVHQQLGSRPFLVAFGPFEDRQTPCFPRPVTEGNDRTWCQQVVLTMAAHGEPLALFWLAFRSGGHVSYRSVERTAALLDLVAPSLLLTRQNGGPCTAGAQLRRTSAPVA